jgi:asparagine synthase (glutamine-hydrolysing)
MCGICGIWGQPDPKTVEAMVNVLHHRGPDDSGIFSDDKVVLGMTRLAIIDLNLTGHQPMPNSEKTIWIVYNGEVYNFQTEREQLEKQGAVFRSTSDTEVVLHLYERYGDEFVKRLRGMFALAIYDKRQGPGRERLMLARDQMGIKPLLYAEVAGRFIFASELKAILASGLVTPEVDPEALRLLLTFGSVYQPRTMIRGVNMLLPGHRLIVQGGRVQIERYWSMGINRVPELRKLSYSEQVNYVDQALADSVQSQLVSDVPLGAFLSGGVDSSILVAMMSRQSARPIKTFSVGFEAEGASIDESKDALITSRFLGTDHRHVLVTGKDLAEHMDRIPCALDQPSVDGVNSYFVSMAARRGMTVAISGTGGDELFAGYPWFLDMAHHPWLSRKATGQAIVRAISELAQNPVFHGFMRTRLKYRLVGLRQKGGFLSQYAQQYQIFGSLGTLEILSREMQSQAHAGRAEALDLVGIDELARGTPVERVTALCMRGYTTNQLLRDIDAVSMSHSLEVRVPYLDHLLMDVALSLPDSTKIGRPTNLPVAERTYRSSGAKRILIDVGKKYLPADFDLQPKRGFGMPFNAWMKGPVREIFMDALSEGCVRGRGWFNPAEVTRLKNQFLGGRITWPQPWLLMIAELWASQYLP